MKQLNWLQLVQCQCLSGPNEGNLRLIAALITTAWCEFLLFCLRPLLNREMAAALEKASNQERKFRLSNEKGQSCDIKFNGILMNLRQLVWDLKNISRNFRQKSKRFFCHFCFKKFQPNLNPWNVTTQESYYWLVSSQSDSISIIYNHRALTKDDFIKLF